MKFTHRLCIGDWSGDGHDETIDFIFKCTHDRSDIINAYKQAEKKCGVGLTDKAELEILNEYEERTISSDAIERLTELGCNFEWRKNDFDEEGDLECYPEDVFNLFLEMVATQFGDEFEYELIKPELPKPINGWWQSDFNEHLGYGVF